MAILHIQRATHALISLRKVRIAGIALSTVAALSASAQAQSISNRHHLDGCAPHSAAVIIPHANVRTVDIGLPVEVEGGYDVLAAAQGEESFDEQFRSRTQSVGPRRNRPARSTTITRGSTTASSEFGSVVLAPRPDHPC